MVRGEGCLPARSPWPWDISGATLPPGGHTVYPQRPPAWATISAATSRVYYSINEAHTGQVAAQSHTANQKSGCCCSVAQTCPTATPETAARQASLSFTLSWSLLKLTSIKSVMPSNHLILSHPLLLLPSILPNIRVFSSESAVRIRGPK